ncbi:hypothetical protein E5345_02020 [Propionibacterium sp. NM47_B9-13]|nr:hypothetical protein CP877_08890 [Cutibacterium modestum]TGY30340.1 hypothetical protein E5345_02020 [Propionibacterium sp. NM47_B9-13]
MFKAFHTDSARLNKGTLISEGPLPTRTTDIDSRARAEPIVTVAMTPVNGKWLVDCNTTVHANNSPPPPLPSHR